MCSILFVVIRHHYLSLIYIFIFTEDLHICIFCDTSKNMIAARNNSCRISTQTCVYAHLQMCMYTCLTCMCMYT